MGIKEIEIVANYHSCSIGESTGNDTSVLSPVGIVDGQYLHLLQRAMEIPGKGAIATLVMLLTLSHKHERSEHILLTSKTLNEHHLSRSTAYRSLELLEAAGLIKVFRQKGRSPTVSLLDPRFDANSYQNIRE